MPSGNHDHEIGRDRAGNPSRSRESVGDKNSKGTGLGEGGAKNSAKPDKKVIDAYKQYADSMTAAGMANLAGPPGFNSARESYDNRSIWDKVLDFVAGPFYDVDQPVTTDPTTYSGGTYHSSTNAIGAVAAIGGAVVGGPIAGIAAEVVKGIAGFTGIGRVPHGSSDDGTRKNSPDNPANKGKGGQPSKGGFNDGRMGQGAVQKMTTKVDLDALIQGMMPMEAKAINDTGGGFTFANLPLIEIPYFTY